MKRAPKLHCHSERSEESQTNLERIRNEVVKDILFILQLALNILGNPIGQSGDPLSSCEPGLPGYIVM